MPKVSSVKVGETELPSPELEPLAVGIRELPRLELGPTAVVILPESKGVVRGTTSKINFDVRKQTYHVCQHVLDPELLKVDLPLSSWALAVETSVSAARANERNE